MNDLLKAFATFSASLVGATPSGGPTAGDVARTLLANYSKDPVFWLNYSRHCLSKEDFKEASLALEYLDECLEEAGSANLVESGMASVREALQWNKLSCHVDMLKKAAKGDPSLQPELIQALQRLAGQCSADVSQNLALSLTEFMGRGEAGQQEETNWLMLLKRLSGSRLAGSCETDLKTLNDLVFALMVAGRYLEAGQMVREARYLSLLAASGESPGKSPWYLLLLDWLNTFLQDPLHSLPPFTTPGPRYVLPLVVWGDPYLDSLERFTLPSLLAPANLPYLQGAGEARMVFFTNPAGALRLDRMPVLAAVRQLVGVDIVTFPDELAEHREVYKLMSAMHLASIEIARASNAHFFFLAPDLVFAGNFLETVDRRLRQGAEVVFVAGLILHMENFKEAQKLAFPEVDGVLSLTPRDLLTLGLRHLHPFVQRNYTYTPTAHRPTAAVFLWPLANGGQVMHGYHHTPFLISAQALARFDGSMFVHLDGDFLPKFLRSEEEMAECILITDPLETNYFELSRHNRFGNPLGSDLGEFDLGEFDLGRLARWGILLGPVAKWLFPQKICFEPEEKDPSDPAYQASTQVVEAIIAGRRRHEQESAYLSESLKDPAHG